VKTRGGEKQIESLYF